MPILQRRSWAAPSNQSRSAERPGASRYQGLASPPENACAFLLCDCRHDAARIQPPHSPGANIREPYRAQADSYRITAFTGELLHNLSHGRIDPRDRKLEGRNPDRTFTEGDLSTRAGHTDFDGFHDLVRLRPNPPTGRLGDVRDSDAAPCRLT